MKLKLISVLALVAMLGATCKHEIPAPVIPVGPPPVVSGTCSADSVYFANAILPVISSGCAITGCHDAITHEEGLVLNSYNGIMRTVSAGNAQQSKLYKVITAQDQGDVKPPPPHSRLSQSSIAAIQKWISQGAPNNQCAGSCDTAIYTFSGAVAPIINTFCKGCHNPASLNGGIDLSAYNGVKSAALSGRLMGSIQHSAGYVAMPQGGNKLQDCQIKQIEKWIAAGSANN